MYDLDLRSWYLDLFLQSTRRRVAAADRATAVAAQTPPAAMPVQAAEMPEVQGLRIHERAQATH